MKIFILSIFFFAALFSTSFSQPEPSWVRFQDGYGNDDLLTDVTTDVLGNIYVTGWTTNNAGNTDYFIAKYNAIGNRLWYHLYDNGGNDTAVSIAVAGSHVYVTGSSETGSGFGANYDITTFVLNTDGTVPPDSNNAIRYDHGRMGRDDFAFKILDPRVRYYTNLTNLFRVDPAFDNVFYVIGTHKDTLSMADHLTVLMYNTGGLIGVGSYDIEGDGRIIGAIPMENSIYVGISNSTLDKGNVYSTLKISNSLDLEWHKMFTNIGGDYPLGITADSSGIYITGTSYSACSDRDVATIKYSHAGEEAWITRAYDCNYTQVGSGAIALDRANVYAGAFHAGGSQYFTYEKSSGDLIWDMGSQLQSYWTSIYPTDSGHIYIAGYRIYYDLPYDGFHLSRYTRLGEMDWETVFDGSSGSGTNTLSTSVRSCYDSSLVMVGSSGDIGQQDMIIIKYKITGLGCPWPVYIRKNWNIVSIPFELDDYSKSLLFPSALSDALTYEDGYVAHDLLENGKGYWIKYPDGGSISLWGLSRTEDTISVEEGWNMVGALSLPIHTSAIGSIPGGIATSNFYEYTGVYKPTTVIEPGKGYWVKVSQTGNLVLNAAADIPSVNRIRIEDTGEMPPQPPFEERDNPVVPREYVLEQNYPNPFNPSADITYSLPSSGIVSLKVFDVLGREVSTLVNERKEIGTHTVKWGAEEVPSGIYFYRLVAGDFTETKKMVLMR